MSEIIRDFTSMAPIPVTYTFDNTPYAGRMQEVRRVVEYRDRATYRSADDGIIGPVGGFLLGSML